MFIAETDSTNDLLRRRYMDEEDLFTVSAGYQTAGRGQQGNGWESERGKNLLFSTLLRDWHIPVPQQFIVNQVVSLSLYHAVLTCLTEDLRQGLAVKWPNDLYFGDRKLAGILVENIWQGGLVNRSIAGIGLNVNQTVFLSSAPNPVSLCQVTGSEHDSEHILRLFLDALRQYRLRLAEADSDIASEYMRVLYRREGFFLWEEREVSLLPSMPRMTRNDSQFLARIDTVLPTGELVLLTPDGNRRTYHFKQIRYVI